MSQANAVRNNYARIFCPLPVPPTSSVWGEGDQGVAGRFSWPAFIDAFRREDTATLHAMIRAEAGFQACLGGKSAKRVGTYLKELEAIKIIVGDGGSFGHQHAAVTGMRRLRELGFSGTFLVSCANGTKHLKQRFDFLVKPFSNLHIDYLDYREIASRKTELGFCFASDLMRQSSFALDKTFNVGHFILVNPTDWPGMAWMGVANEVDCRNAYVNAASSILAEGILDCRSRAAGDSGDARAALVDYIVAGKLEGQWNLVSVYGLRDWPSTAKKNLLRRATQIGLDAEEELRVLAQAFSGRSGTAKPVIVPVLDKLEPQALVKLLEYERVKIVRDGAELAALRLEQGDVVFVYLPLLPSEQFEKLALHADVFVAEGANGVSFAKKEGIAFLRGGRAYLDARSEQSMPESTVYRNASLALQHAFFEDIPNEPDLLDARLRASLLTLEKRGEHVRTLMELCFAGKLGDFYREAASRFKARPDKIYAALMLILADKGAR